MVEVLSVNVGQIYGDLRCLGGASSSRIRGVPRLLFQTGRDIVTLLSIRAKYVFQGRDFRTTCRTPVQVENLLFENKMLERGAGYLSEFALRLSCYDHRKGDLECSTPHLI